MAASQLAVATAAAQPRPCRQEDVHEVVDVLEVPEGHQDPVAQEAHEVRHGEEHGRHVYAGVQRGEEDAHEEVGVRDALGGHNVPVAHKVGVAQEVPHR